MNAVVNHAELTFRVMCPQDVAQVMEIEERAYPFPWTDKIFIDCIEAGYHCWVLERNQVMLGYVVFINAVGECHLLNICIDPELHNQGLGRKLLRQVLQAVRVDRVKCVFLEVRPSNTRAVQLYQSEGFNEVGVRQKYYPTKNGREDAIIFAKQL